MNSTVKSYDAIIVGGGHNALVTAFYLARAGVRTLVLERRNGVGGAAVTEDLYPGFKCPALAHAVGPLHPKVVDDLALHHHGVRFTEPEVRLFAPLPDHHTDTDASVAKVAELRTMSEQFGLNDEPSDA